jgi:hypothetical protein
MPLSEVEALRVWYQTVGQQLEHNPFVELFQVRFQHTHKNSAKVAEFPLARST